MINCESNLHGLTSAGIMAHATFYTYMHANVGGIVFCCVEVVALAERGLLLA